MLNVTVIQDCRGCYDNKCIFGEYRSKRDSITGLYIAYIDKHNENDCTIYCGF